MTELDIKQDIEDFKHYSCLTYGPTVAPPTCKITDTDIENITKFLCRIITNCRDTNITLNDLSKGKILNRGSFGYTYKVGNDKNIIIKIIVCTKETIQTDIIKEIELLETLTTFNKDNYINLYGYFKRIQNTYEFTKISVPTPLKIDCIDKSYTFGDSCEMYLLMEEGNYDLTKFKSPISLINIIKFIDLLNFYKLSKKIIKMNKGIFIHSDIKLENIILSKDDKFKLIDFGLSQFSNTFFSQNANGTPYFFNLLFTYQNKFDYRLCVTSPLYDIFCLLLSYFELCLQKRLTLPTYTVDEINKRMNLFINLNKDIEKYIEGLLIIFNSIYNYHQEILKKYYEELDKSGGYFMRFTSYFVGREKAYINLYNLRDFTLINIESSKKSLIPIYEDTGNKLFDEIKYVERLINFALPSHILEDDSGIISI